MVYSNPRTLAVSAGRSDRPGAALNEGMHPASNFILGGEREYSRDDGTPTWAAFECIVGTLEHGNAVAFASGMAAIAAVVDQVPVGGHIVWPEDCYQALAGLITAGEHSGRWTATRLSAEATDSWCDAARQPTSSGSSRPRTRCSRSSTSAASPPPRAGRVRSWPSTTRSPALLRSSLSPLVPMSRCSPPRSTSAATRICCAASRRPTTRTSSVGSGHNVNCVGRRRERSRRSWQHAGHAPTQSEPRSPPGQRANSPDDSSSTLASRSSATPAWQHTRRTRLQPSNSPRSAASSPSTSPEAHGRRI